MTSRLKNILIMGSSNTILKGGWVDGFRSAMTDVNIERIGAGKSPSVQFASIIGHSFENYDLVILENLVNDSGLIEGSEFCFQVLCELISTVKSKTSLICVGITGRWHYLRRSVSASECQHRKITEKFEGKYFSATDYLLKAVGEPHPSHYEGVSHIAPHLAFDMGVELAKRVESFLRQPLTGEDVSGIYRTYDADFFGEQVEVVRKVNSLFDLSLLTMRPKHSLNFGKSGRLVGLYIDETRSNGLLRGGGGDKDISIDLIYGRINQSDGFTIKFVPIKSENNISSVSIAQMIEGLESAPLTLLDRYRRLKKTQSIDVVSFVLRDDDRSANFRRSQPLGLSEDHDL